MAYLKGGITMSFFTPRPHAVILDIGAQSKYFARCLRISNLNIRQLIFCGEPKWRGGDNPIPSSWIPELIAKKAKGIFPVVSHYNKFDFPDASLDMVTLNAPYLMMPPRGIEKELVRTLKPGGIFFFAYPVQFSPMEFPPETFILRKRGIFHDTGLIDLAEIPGYPRHLPSQIWPSKVMKYNIREAWKRSNISGYRNRMGNAYMYRDMPLVNGYQIWQKL